MIAQEPMVIQVIFAILMICMCIAMIGITTVLLSEWWRNR